MCCLNERPDETSALACKLVGKDFAERKAQLSQGLFSYAEETVELPDAYAFRFPSQSPWPEKAIEFIQEERRCCPFFSFELRFEPDGGPLWLRIGGSPEVKQFLLSELGVPTEA